MTSHKKPTPRDRSLAFPTVRFWQRQLNASGIRDYSEAYIGTRSVYLYRLTAFNGWLPGRVFDVRVQAVADGKIVRKDLQR